MKFDIRKRDVRLQAVSAVCGKTKMNEDLSLVILAGGKAQRMGQNKAFLPIAGVPLIQRIINRLSGLACETLISAPQIEEFAHLKLRCVPDIIPDHGCLGGLYSALFHASRPLVAVVACDMPFVNLALLSSMAQSLRDNQADAVVPQSGDFFEPLHAVYRRSSCLPAVQNALSSGSKRLTSWYPHIKLLPFTPEETAIFDPSGLAFTNLNTVEDVIRISALIQSIEENAHPALQSRSICEKLAHQRQRVILKPSMTSAIAL